MTYFTVEVKDANKLKEGEAEVELFLDREALTDLCTQLSFLHKVGDHAHFMTSSWGGHELTERVYRTGNSLIHHLRISLVDSGD